MDAGGEARRPHPIDSDRVIVDHVGRYESLAESLDFIAGEIGLSGGIVLPAERTESHLRTDRRHRHVLSAEGRFEIRSVVGAVTARRRGAVWSGRRTSGTTETANQSPVATVATGCIGGCGKG